MKSIKVTLNSNKTFNVENLDEVKILEDENNATIIEVQFPSDYEEYSKRVDFLNMRNEKWTTSLYAPEDERNQYGEDFNKLNFRFTIPSAMAKRGELQIQFVAYLADGTDTIVPFQVLLATINKSIIFATKQGKDNPDLIIKAYEYSNQALELSREALDRTANSERAALESEKSAKSAEKSANEAKTSAKNAETSANESKMKAINAETSAKEAQNSAKYAESVSNTANGKSDNAVAVSNSANEKSNNAVTISNNALTTSQNALAVANDSNDKADKAVNTAKSANTKSDNAVNIATEAKSIAQEANNIANSSNEKSDNSVLVANTANDNSTKAVNTANDANTKSDNALQIANEAKESSTSAVDTSDSALSYAKVALARAMTADSSADKAVETSNSAKQIAEDALNQVVEKMGTKVYLGENETPESSLNFTSDPQTQINANTTLSDANKERLDNHDKQFSNQTIRFAMQDKEISSAKTRTTNLENQPVITKILYDEDGNVFEFKGKWKSDTIEIDGSFVALNKNGGGFSVTDDGNVGVEIGKRDGTAGTPYIDFHTDGSSSTDYNARIIGNGNALHINANGGLFINNWKALALRNKVSKSTTVTLTGGTTTRTYDRTIGIIDLNSCAIVTFAGTVDPAYASNQGDLAQHFLCPIHCYKQMVHQ